MLLTRETKKMHDRKLLSVALIVFMSFNVLAAKKDGQKKPQRYPTGCYQKGFDIKHQVLMLHPEKAGKADSMYFIHNLTSHPIRLQQMRSGDEPFVMHLNATVQPNAWGVYASDEKSVKFICTKPSYGSKFGEMIDCSGKLDICEYTNVKFGNNIHGNYWVVNSASMRRAQRSATRQGALLRPEYDTTQE